MFCEDRSENFEFGPFDFQSVCLVSCKQEGTRLTTHTKFILKSRILMTSDTNSSIHYAFKKCFYRFHHTDEILSSSFSSYL